MTSTSVPSSSLSETRSWFQRSSMMLKLSIILFCIYALISLLIATVSWCFPQIIQHIVFMNLVNKPNNLTHPELLQIRRVHNFYLNVENQVTIGIWHYHSPLTNDSHLDGGDDQFQRYFSSNPSNIPVIIYLHGNAFDRSAIHRRELCQKLRDELKYDVFALDYRGFGDSTGEPTEKGLVNDSEFVYNWLVKLTNGQRRIYIWGHSMGTAIATKVAKHVSDPQKRTFAGLILEAPFLDIHQAILTHWFSLFFRWQPWYYGMTDRMLRKHKLYFLTREYLAKVNGPCVILHADDDLTVPYIHSKQLLQTAINIRDRHRQEKKFPYFQIDMISFHREGYGHRLIYQAPKLVSALKRVIFEEDL